MSYERDILASLATLVASNYRHTLPSISNHNEYTLMNSLHLYITKRYYNEPLHTWHQGEGPYIQGNLSMTVLRVGIFHTTIAESRQETLQNIKLRPRLKKATRQVLQEGK